MTLGELFGHARKRFWLLFRYGVSGICGALVQISALYIWVSILGFRDTYLLGAFVGFCLALVITFTLQKFWTFRDRALHHAHRQAFWYTAVAVLSVGVNIIFLAVAKEFFAFIHVDFFAGWYVVVQAGSVFIIAMLSFLLNYFFTFREGGPLSIDIAVIRASFKDWLTTSEAPFILLLAGLSILIFSPFLFGGMMYAGSEQLGGFYQYSLFYSKAIAQGESFLFDPHPYGGALTYINQFGDFLFPPVYLFFRLFPPFFAYNLTLTLATFAGLAFAYLFGRALSLSRPASFILALTYATAQTPLIFQAGLSYVHSFLVLPLLLYCLVQIKKVDSVRALLGYTALGAVGMGIGVLAGYFSTFLYALLCAGMFALFLDFFGDRIGYPRNYRALFSFGVMGIIGIVVGFPQLIGLYEYGPFTARTAEYATESAKGSSLVIGDFVRLLFPPEISFPIPGSGGAAFLYYGFLPLVCLLIAAFFFYQDILVLFFGLLLLVFIALAMNLPGFALFNTHAPIFDRIGTLTKWLLIGGLPAGYLAGYGFDRIGALRSTDGFKRFWKIVRSLSLVGVFLLAFIQVPLGILASSNTVRYWIFTKVLGASGRSLESLKHPVSYYTDTIGQELGSIQHTFSFSNPHFDVFLILVLLGVLAMQYVIRIGSSWRVKALFLVVVTGTFLAPFWADFSTYAVPMGSYFTEPPPVAQAMLDQDPATNTFRFATFEGEELWRDLHDKVGVPFTPENVARTSRDLLLLDAGSAYGLEAISGHDPILSLRQNQLIYAALEMHADLAIDVDLIKAGAPLDHYNNASIVSPVTAEGKALDIEKRIPLLSMMNVKYLISLYPLTDPRLEKISSFSLPDLDVNYALYQNKTVLPRLYFAPNPTLWQGSGRDLLVAMLETSDFSKKTFIECSGCMGVPAPAKGSVSVFRAENGLVEASTTSSTGGWVVFSESNLPGWVAEIDGVRVPIATANYLFQAVNVPKGTHTVTFRYIGSFGLFLERFGL